MSVSNLFIGDYVAPDYMEKQKVYRAWNMAGGKLISTSAKSRWKKTMQANCFKQNHAAPQQNCSCGLYGYFELEKAFAMEKADVVGVCSVWGKAEMHKDGLRAQYAQIDAIQIMPTKELLQNMSRKQLKAQISSNALAFNTLYHQTIRLSHQKTHGIFQKVKQFGRYNLVEKREFFDFDADLWRFPNHHKEIKQKLIALKKLQQKGLEAKRQYNTPFIENWAKKHNIKVCDMDYIV